MSTSVAIWTDDQVHSRAVPIDGNARVALGLLLRAYTFARDAGADVWDFALEIDTLLSAGLTISDLRWLVAKRFAEHGHESSIYGGSHRTFRRGGAGPARPTAGGEARRAEVVRGRARARQGHGA